MEQTYKVQIVTKGKIVYVEEIKALNELEALDRVQAKYKNILDIKVVE